MAMTGKVLPVRARAFARSFATWSRSPATSPLPTERLDILSPLPGDSEVTSQAERDSSRETETAAKLTSMAARATPGAVADIVASRMLAGGSIVPNHPRYAPAHRICFQTRTRPLPSQTRILTRSAHRVPFGI